MINTAKLKAATTGFKATFNKSLRSTVSSWAGVAMKVVSTTFEEEYGWLKETPGIREWLGDRVISTLEAEGYKIRNRDFEKTIGVDRNIVKDERYGLMSNRFEQLGHDAGEFPDELVFDAVRNAFTRTCFDGQYFFDTDHPLIAADGSQTTYANTDGGAASDMWMMIDDSRPIMPFVLQEREAFSFTALDDPTDENVFLKRQFIYGIDGRYGGGYGFPQLAWGSKQPLTVANFEVGLTAMGSFRGDHGKRLNLRPRKLWVPPRLEGAGRDILKVANNAAGATNKWQGVMELEVCGWLA